jgi:2,3-dihydroxybiphenyl 1,2-dioxygenase
MFAASDPFGNRLEFFVGHHHARTSFLSPTGVRFITGPLGIGHAFLWISSVDTFLDFYVDTLGFALSDTLEVGQGPPAQFLHCNPRHHTLAGMVNSAMPLGLGHLMLEVDTLDAVGAAYDRCINAGIPIFATLGKHANDQVVSFYAESPSGFPVEYGVHGRLIDDATWVVSHYTEDRIWGHAGPSDPRA